MNKPLSHSNLNVFRRLRVLILLMTMVTVTGCAVMTVGAVVVSASAVHDRRSVETVIGDQRLQLDVRRALVESDHFNGRSGIDINVYNGWVLLIGEVDTDAKVNQASALVQDLSGVRRLFNELSTAPKASVRQLSRDAVLALQVKAAIADIKDLPGFDASRVKVATRRQTVYLQGLVTEQESQRVVDAARYVRGVNQVVVALELIEDDN